MLLVLLLVSVQTILFSTVTNKCNHNVLATMLFPVRRHRLVINLPGSFTLLGNRTSLFYVIILNYRVFINSHVQVSESTTQLLFPSTRPLSACLNEMKTLLSLSRS
jgi:hypothetical protein